MKTFINIYIQILLNFYYFNSMSRFSKKICVITGGTDGIGLGIAERFAQEGAKVIICSRNEKNVKAAQEALKEYDIEAHQCNVGNEKQRAEFFQSVGEKYGKIDVLVLNVAWSTHFGMQLDITEKAYDKMFEVNVKSTFFAIKEAKPYLEKGENPNEWIG